MVRKLDFGFKMLFSAAAVLTLAGVFVLSSCSSEKKDEVEVEETVETEAVMEAATPAPADEDSSSMNEGATGAQPTAEPRMRVEGQVPPELAEPCMAKNAGDSCTVVITGGRQIEGQCRETRTGQLACMPKARPGNKDSRTQ